MRYMFIISLQVMRTDNSSALILETSNLMNINIFGEYFRTSGQKTTRDFGGEHSIPPPFLLCPSQKTWTAKSRERKVLRLDFLNDHCSHYNDDGDINASIEKASIGTEDDGEYCEAAEDNPEKKENVADVEACKVGLSFVK